MTRFRRRRSVSPRIRPVQLVSSVFMPNFINFNYDDTAL